MEKVFRDEFEPSFKFSMRINIISINIDVKQGESMLSKEKSAFKRLQTLSLIFETYFAKRRKKHFPHLIGGKNLRSIKCKKKSRNWNAEKFPKAFQEDEKQRKVHLVIHAWSYRRSTEDTQHWLPDESFTNLIYKHFF